MPWSSIREILTVGTAAFQGQGIWRKPVLLKQHSNLSDTDEKEGEGILLNGKAAITVCQIC